MVSLFTSVRLLRLKQYEYNHTTEVDCVKVKNKYYCAQGEYTEEKNEYFQSQCSNCKNPSKLRKDMQHVDKLFRSYKCLYMSWNFNQPLILFFSNGAIVSLKLNSENNTLLKVDVDENLCGKFLASRIVDVIISKNYIYVSYVEPMCTVIQINHDAPNLLSKVFGKKKGKVVGFEPKIFNFDLCVYSPKPAERKLSMNKQEDLLLVWWKNSSDDVWPWMPISYLTDRLNLFVYSICDRLFELLYPVKVENELLHATFSREHSYKFFCLEESKTDNVTTTIICTYEITEGHCQIIHSEKLPIDGHIIAFDWSLTGDKLLASDSNGFLIIYDANSQSSVVDTYSLKFLPLHIAWHPQACVALIVCRNNHVLCVDVAFNLIQFQLCYRTNSQSDSIDLGSFFSTKFTVHKVMWQKSAYNDACLLFLDPEMSSFIIVKFALGFITGYNLTSLELISEYLKCNEVERAKSVYMQLNWEFNSELKFVCLSKIVNYLLRRPLNFDAQCTLECLFGTFYCWMDYLPRRVFENYEPKMYHMARCFFHRLLRCNQFEKAWSLAIDLDSQDLFLDLYQVAKENNKTILAAIALRKAEEYDSSVTDSCSESCMSDSCSESSSVSYSEHHKRKMESRATFKNMYQDLLDGISDSQCIEIDDERSLQIDKAFEALNFKPNKIIDGKKFLYPLKQETSTAEVFSDIGSEHSADLSTTNYNNKSSFKLSLPQLSFDEGNEFSEFRRNLKYATTPLCNKSNSNITLHKSSQTVAYRTTTLDNECTPLQNASKSSRKINTSEPVSGIFHESCDSDKSKVVKSMADTNPEKFDHLSSNYQPVSFHNKRLSYIPSFGHETGSSKTLLSANLKHFPSLSNPFFQTESAPDFSFKFSSGIDSKFHEFAEKSNLANSLLDNPNLLHPKKFGKLLHENEKHKNSNSLQETSDSDYKTSRSVETIDQTFHGDNLEFSSFIPSRHYKVSDSSDTLSVHSTLSKHSDSKCSFSSGQKDVHNTFLPHKNSHVLSYGIEGAANLIASFALPENNFQKSSLSQNFYGKASDCTSENTTHPSTYFKNVKSSHNFPLKVSEFYRDFDSNNVSTSTKHSSLYWDEKDQDNALNKNISHVTQSHFQKSEISSAFPKTDPNQNFKQICSSFFISNDTKYSKPSPHHSLPFFSTSVDSHLMSDPYNSESKVCDNQLFCPEEESEEVDGTKIKQAHLGII